MSRTSHTTGALLSLHLLLLLTKHKMEKILEHGRAALPPMIGFFTLGPRTCKDVARNSVKYSFIKTCFKLRLRTKQRFSERNM